MNQTPHFCPNCGAERRRANARFCHKCGHALAPVAAVPSPKPQSKPKKSRWPLLLGILLLVLVAIVAFVALGPGRDLLRKPTQDETPTAKISKRSETPPFPSTKEPSSASTEPSTSTPAEATPPPATTMPEDTATPVPTVPPQPTDTPVPTATPQPTNPPPPTATPIPTPNWEAYRMAVTNVVRDYGRIKAEALRTLDYRPYKQVLVGDVLERQRRHICKYIDDEVYYTFSDRHFQVIDISFMDERHAEVLASISENRFLHRQRDGKVIKSFVDEEYDAVYQLERFGENWFITCFQVVDEDDPNKECEVKLPTPNPCND